MKIVFVPPTFSCGLLVPGHVCIVNGSTALDLRTDARMQSSFWSYFRCCSFSRQEAAAAIRRKAKSRSHRKLVGELAMIPTNKLPNTVDATFLEFETSFGLVTMGICHDTECPHALMLHAHAYQLGVAIPGIKFSNRGEARAWVNYNRELDGANAHALRVRIRDWPGMPTNEIAAPASTISRPLEQQTA